jgi:hypothetical protein
MPYIVEIIQVMYNFLIFHVNKKKKKKKAEDFLVHRSCGSYVIPLYVILFHSFNLFMTVNDDSTIIHITTFKCAVIILIKFIVVNLAKNCKTKLAIVLINKIIITLYFFYLLYYGDVN